MVSGQGRRRSRRDNSMNSMTGFGRGETEGGGYKVQAEIRTLNHRFLDLHIRLPRTLLAMEERLRKLVASRLVRGRVELNLTLEPVGESSKYLALDTTLLSEVLVSLEDLRQRCHIGEPVALEHLLRFPDLITVKDRTDVDPEVMWELIAAAAGQALEAVVEMRRVEGENLKKELARRLGLIQDILRDIAQRASEVPRKYRDKLTERLQELLPEANPVDEARLLQEVAYLAERADIMEELTRLESHVDQMQASLEADGSVGRKMDFLIQEIHREINTVGSKVTELRIAQAVIAVKTELERLREQIQNVE